MKSYEEMANDALKRIYEHNVDKRRKKKIAVKMIATICPALIVKVAGAGICKSGLMTPPDNHLLIENQIIVTTENNKTTYISTEKTNEDIITTTESTDTNNTEITITTSKSLIIINDSVQNREDTFVTSDDSIQNTEETETYIGADRLGDAYINGDYFLQDTNIDLYQYTSGECIGNATDFEGYYKDVHFDVTFYYAMEDVNIVLVKFSDGRTLALKNQNDTSFCNPEN